MSLSVCFSRPGLLSWTLPVEGRQGGKLRTVHFGELWRTLSSPVGILLGLLSLGSRRATVGQGAVMGLGNSFIDLGRIVGPIWAGFIFDVNPSYPYLTGTMIMFTGFLISLARVSQGMQEAASPGLQPAPD